MDIKEENEYLDSIRHWIGYVMTPFQEMMLLGFDIERFYRQKDKEIAYYGNDDDEDIDPAMEYEYEEEYEKYGYIEGEYDFDEEDEELKLLDNILRYNNDRNKYFA
jgi:hypothetical protein